MIQPPPRRLFVAQDLAPGAEIALDAAAAHRLLHVLRAKRGDQIALFNGRDGEWRAELIEASKRRTALGLRELLRAQEAEPDIWLLFAPIKRARLDWMVEKAVELGAGSLFPVFTARTDPTRVSMERMRAIAIEAAEQCGRLTVPEAREPEPLATLLARWPAGRKLILLDETHAGRPIARALAAVGADPLGLLCGPEGGFTKTELDALRALPFAVAADLGPRVLRAETATLAALACVQAWRAGGDAGGA